SPRRSKSAREFSCSARTPAARKPSSTAAARTWPTPRACGYRTASSTSCSDAPWLRRVRPMAEIARRPELVYDATPTEIEVADRPRSTLERLYDNGAVRKTALLVVLAAVWEIYARVLDNGLLLPTFSATVAALAADLVAGEIPRAAAYTLGLLVKGYAAGLAIAAVLTAFASVSRIGADLLETLTAMFNPLPSIALLPLAMIWFGLGDASVIFVVIHAVLWAVALNTFTGFKSLSPTLKMVGQSYGLSPLVFIARILIPGAFPSILTGL